MLCSTSVYIEGWLIDLRSVNKINQKLIPLLWNIMSLSRCPYFVLLIPICSNIHFYQFRSIKQIIRFRFTIDLKITSRLCFIGKVWEIISLEHISASCSCWSFWSSWSRSSLRSSISLLSLFSLLSFWSFKGLQLFRSKIWILEWFSLVSFLPSLSSRTNISLFSFKSSKSLLSFRSLWSSRSSFSSNPLGSLRSDFSFFSF